MDEDFFILKITNLGIIDFYVDYCNRKRSLEYVICKINDQNQDIISYTNISKSQNLKNVNKEINDHFNTFVHLYLDNKYKDIIKSGNQIAFMFCRKKDGLFDMERWKETKSVFLLSKGKHTEDEIFEQLSKIHYEDDCCYSELYIFTTNSPCMLRHDKIPCMVYFVILENMLYDKHGIKIIIRYLKPWGFSGSYEVHLPECPIKDCIYNFDNQTLGSKYIINESPQTQTDTKEIDVELISAIYKQIIPEIENLVFSMKNTKIRKPKLDLAQFSSKISQTEIREMFIVHFNYILSDLFLAENSNKTFSNFRERGLEMFEQCMIKIGKLLNEINCAIICEEIREYLKIKFFPWWAKNVEDAYSKFLKKEISCFLQKIAVCLFHRDIKKMENYFDIGCMILENCNILLL